MRVQKMPVLAVAVVAAGLSLTACDGGGSKDASSAASAAPSQSAADGGTATPEGGSPSASPKESTSASPKESASASGSPETSAPAKKPASDSHSAKVTKPAAEASAPRQSAPTGCKTSHLKLSASGGKAEGQVLIHLKNTGSATCSMQGFPGVDLKSQFGSYSAERTTSAAPRVTLRTGQDTRFTLRFPPNHSGGSGLTFTSMVVTPPNETHSRTLKLYINVPATDSAMHITVSPVGADK
ncbi:DUF4232 domain-containing protein [Streptomyces pinistramenti]|uniref:DUF4232 domain-containing protein n=1 Tax=Streptomyces pinistramenti TaxID=2884812 RepID=UPI001D06BB00|nr:DUF4232 domain-containing protein [Streptomyces pinistramenti]MCB5907906.1 DUF4232 domain-containing protein [Streptomyces pinistramenti]